MKKRFALSALALAIAGCATDEVAYRDAGLVIGAASGAVIGFLSTILGGRRAPSAAYTNFVDRCLRERGYEPTGSQ